MRATIVIVSLLLMLGAVYFLAKINVIPVGKLAASSPSLQKSFAMIGLWKPPVKKQVASKQKAPKKRPASQQVSFTRSENPSPNINPTATVLNSSAPIGQTPAETAPTASASELKLEAIYATMSPDDIARIGAKQPDSELIKLLSSLDEKKAGMVLAALPDARAAKITREMVMSVPQGGSNHSRSVFPLKSL